MVAVTQMMAAGTGKGRLATLWRRIRLPPRNHGIYTFVLVFAAAILVAAGSAALVANTILDPNIIIVGGNLSPDGKWVVLTEQVDAGPAMGDVDTAVELRHHDGLLMGPTGNRVFLLKFKSSKIELRRVKWYTHNLLEVTVRADREDMPKPITQVEDVLIDYRRLDWQ